MEEKQLTSKELEEQANALLAEADFEEIKLPKKAKKAAAAKKAAEEAAQPEKPAEKFPPLDEKLVASLPAAALLQGSEKLMEIFAKGKAKGKLSSNDLMETIDEMNLESEQLDQIYDSLETLGIDIGTAEAIDNSIDDIEPPDWLVMDRTKNFGVVSFASDADRRPLQVTGIEVAGLRRADQELLRGGITVGSQEQLLLLLEDLGS